jgi:hypothetical protein
VSALLLAVVVAIFVITLALRQSEPTPADVAWLAGPGLSRAGGGLNDDAADVCERYLTRHRRHRLIGGLSGILFAAIIGVRWFGSVTIGMGQGSPLADLLFCGVSGVIVGTLSAESFRLTSATNTQRAASLGPRRPLAGGGRITGSRIIAVAAIAAGIAAALTDHGNLALVTSMILLVPLGLAELVIVIIAGRSRPAMTDRARYLDERLRAFAGASLSHLHLATSSLMLGWTLSKVDALSGLLAFARFFVVIGCLVIAVVMLRRAAPRPSGRLLLPNGTSFA